ncbi:hypothetical protein [Helicovermis profundi]|uniref:Uncharacterized protein n=1 Tax=Helicovermis profundi TaxID=3065157 RepID=A0AAU9EN10_9FIRM|nr:hypothetical protein HLPR_01660 [Clostridia bacterium S502]
MISSNESEKKPTLTNKKLELQNGIEFNNNNKERIIDTINPKLIALSLALSTIGIYLFFISTFFNEIAFTFIGPFIITIILIIIGLIGMLITDKIATFNDYKNRELLVTIYLDIVLVLGLSIIIVSFYFAYIVTIRSIGENEIINRAFFISILGYRFASKIMKRLYSKFNIKTNRSPLSLEKNIKFEKVALYFVALVILIISYVPSIVIGIDEFEFNGVSISLSAIESVVLPAVLINLSIDQFKDTVLKL